MASQNTELLPAAEAVGSSQWQRGVAKLLRNRAAVVGGIIIVIFLLSALFAPILYPGNPNAPNLIHSLERPSASHLLGTDQLGRDILGRILYGGRVSLTIALGSVAMGMIFGIPLGLVSGYFGGKTDFLVQRLTDIMLSFPPFILALALVAVLGVGLKNTLISVGIAGIPHTIRITRGCVLSIREQVYVEAARAVGTRDSVILVRHILPNVMVPIIVNSTLFLGMAILFAAGLGFLGVGIQPPTPEWGTMLGSGRSYLFAAPHVATFPGIAIFLVVLGFNLLGDGLRDALDPRMGYE
ncbi:MAG: ABC transporter permease [Deltaproteobacteria bacterium]|jgi:ABC-type dipeptide/oligopeptide/nickel transport system permease subunit|nr:ABC transporter permease [Deltaproteobacteria bacterium]MBT4637707.1 ABC transporter permease [Deltaproteobacteria bacterium]MBT6501001.1 ABC transporter permease [Deltaproteobacteria bacterium]MBT7714547.1 ABC transporter permease [Deltaproteobacteria bacterium]